MDISNILSMLHFFFSRLFLLSFYLIFSWRLKGQEKTYCKSVGSYLIDYKKLLILKQHNLKAFSFWLESQTPNVIQRTHFHDTLLDTLHPCINLYFSYFICYTLVLPMSFLIFNFDRFIGGIKVWTFKIAF